MQKARMENQMNKGTQEKKALDMLERSNEVHAQIFGKKEPDANQNSSDANVNVPAIEDDKGIQPEVVTKDSNVTEPTKVVEPQKSDKQPDAKPKKVDDFEKKYSVLQSKYNAEVPRYAAQLKEKEEQIRALKDLIIDAKKEPLREEPKKIPERAFDAQPQPTTSTEVEVKPFDIEVNKQLKPEDKSDFGEEWVDLIVRGSNEVVDLKLKDYNIKVMEYINSRIRQIEQKLSSINLDDIKNELKVVKTTQAQTAEEKYISYLDEHCPNWDSVRDTNEFAEWLEQPSPESGFLRKDLLIDAHRRLDSNRVALLYNAFMRTHKDSNVVNENLNKPVKPIAEEFAIAEEPVVPQPVVTVPKPQFKPEAEQHVQPRRTVAGNIPVNNREEIPSYDDIAKAQRKLRAGLITIDEFNSTVKKVTDSMLVKR